MAQIPFTAYLEITPDYGTRVNPSRLPSDGASAPQNRRSKWVAIRSSQKISQLVYEALVDAPGLTLAQPTTNVFNTGAGKFSNASSGVGVVPQFGNSPPRLMFEGFANFDSVEASEQPAAVTQVFHANEVLSGYKGQQPWRIGGMPTTDVEDQVALLKATIENAIAGLPGSPRVFRIFFKGITWGDRAHHFPTSL